MESALSPLADHLTCDQCQQALQDRIKNLVVQWSIVKVRELTVFYVYAVDIRYNSGQSDLPPTELGNLAPRPTRFSSPIAGRFIHPPRHMLSFARLSFLSSPFKPLLRHFLAA